MGARGGRRPVDARGGARSDSFELGLRRRVGELRRLRRRRASGVRHRLTPGRRVHLQTERPGTASLRYITRRRRTWYSVTNYVLSTNCWTRAPTCASATTPAGPPCTIRRRGRELGARTALFEGGRRRVSQEIRRGSSPSAIGARGPRCGNQGGLPHSGETCATPARTPRAGAAFSWDLVHYLRRKKPDTFLWDLVHSCARKKAFYLERLRVVRQVRGGPAFQVREVPEVPARARRLCRPTVAASTPTRAATDAFAPRPGRRRGRRRGGFKSPARRCRGDAQDAPCDATTKLIRWK